MKTKTCTACDEELSIDLFYKNKRRKDGLNSQCKRCSNTTNDTTRKKDMPKYRKFRSASRQRLQIQMNNWKIQQGCKCCPERTPCCLELHHLDPSTKEGNPSLLATSWKRFMKEAEKCVVVCCNCHRKIHKGVLTLPDK